MIRTEDVMVMDLQVYQPTNNQSYGFGRYWISEKKIGLQNMSRKIRHTLCKDTMTDIDLKNSHPTLLAAYCHQNNIPCKGLEQQLKQSETC